MCCQHKWLKRASGLHGPHQWPKQEAGTQAGRQAEADRIACSVYKGHFVWTTLRVMPRGETGKKTVGKCFKTDGLNFPCAVKVQMNVKVRAAVRVLPPGQRPRTLRSLKMYSCTRFIYKSRVRKLVRFSTFQQTFSGTRTECAPVQRQPACLLELLLPVGRAIIHSIAGRAFITSICIPYFFTSFSSFYSSFSWGLALEISPRALFNCCRALFI